MVTGSFTLYGIEDLYAYIVSCSSGSTIPTKADGTCKAAVTVNFKKKTDDGLVVFAAPKVIISVLNSSGVELSTETYNNRNAVDVTEMINTAGVSAYTLNVQLLDGESLLVSESFLISRDSDLYTIECDKGSVIKCTEKGIVSSAVTFSATKNGAMIANPTGYKMVASFDRFLNDLTFDEKTSVTFSSGQAYSGSEIVIWKLIEKATEEVIAVNKFSFIFETPIYRAGKTPWSSINRYNNGEYIEYEGLIYLWNFPIKGNSTKNPKDDVASNPLTTKWKVYEISDLLAARILLADFAKVGQTVFQGNYMLSQQGTDADGNPSSSYDKFNPATNAFNPNILLDFMTGKAILNDLEANGSVSTKRDGRRIMIDAKTNTVKMISESETGYIESLAMGFTEVLNRILPYIKLINTLGEKLNISPTSIILNKENSTSLTLTRDNINLSNTANDNSVLAADSLKVTGAPDGGDPVYKNKSTTITSDGIESINLVSNDSIRITPDRVTISNGSGQSYGKTFEILVRGRYPGDSVDQDDRYITLKFMNGFLVLE